MASTKPSSTRRSPARTGSGKGEASEISPARWAGVALVIAALVGAIGLAIVSPTEPDTETVAPGLAPVDTTPGPSIEVTDTRVPTARPVITRPASGYVTGEWEIEVAVDIPEEALAKRLLTLVVLRDGAEIGEQPKPSTGSSDTVATRLVAGPNEITAALKGPGGLLGPPSDPVLVTLDRDAPGLQVTAPKTRTKVFDDTITVAGTSEPGAEVSITNAAQGYDPGPFVVGPSGTFETAVPLKKGRNEIVATSVDEAGQTREDSIVVIRKDGKPVINLIVPERIERSRLPRKIKLVVEVTDTDGEKMEGAVVSWTIGGDDRVAETFEDETKANGRSAWSPQVGPGSSLLVGVEVTSPHGQTRSSSREVPLR